MDKKCNKIVVNQQMQFTQSVGNKFMEKKLIYRISVQKGINEADESSMQISGKQMVYCKVDYKLLSGAPQLFGAVLRERGRAVQ